MEDSTKTLTQTKIKRIVSQSFSIFIELGCFLFVFIQTYQCIEKYINDPQGTDIRIVEGTRETYPDITICPLYGTSYTEVLKQCNLTHELYFSYGIWIGTGSHEFCSKPDKLFEEMTKSAFEGFEITYMDFDDPNYYIAKEFINKDWSEFGRCKTFAYPKNVKGLWTVKLESNPTTFQVIISTPGYFVSREYHSILLEPDYDATVKVTREVIQVLDYEGQPCKMTLTRDDCVYEYIFKVS